MDATYYDLGSMDLDLDYDPVISGYPPEDSPVLETSDTLFFDEDEAAVLGLKLSYHQSCGSPTANSCTSDDMPVTPLSSSAESESFGQPGELETETEQTIFINSSHLYSELLDQFEKSESVDQLGCRSTTTGQINGSSPSTENPAAVKVIQKIKMASSSPTEARHEQTCQNPSTSTMAVAASQPSPWPTIITASTSLKARQDMNNLPLANNDVKKVGVKRKAIQEKGDAKKAKRGQDSASVSRNEKNAIAARENRLKKKMEFEELKRKETLLQEENECLRKEKSDHEKTIRELEQEVAYYKSVLLNQSSLATILHKLDPQPKLKLSSSVGVSFQDEVVGGQKMSGGVCLHVNGTDTSIEWCAKCSMKAQSSFHS